MKQTAQMSLDQMGDNIKTDLTEMGQCELDSSGSERVKLVGSCEHGNEN